MRRVLVLLLLLGSCALPPVPAPGPAPPSVTSGPVATSDAHVLLATLAVTERPRPNGTYRREVFGRAWADVDGNGCNQRDDVLLRDAVPGTTVVAAQGRCPHDVLAGTWIDPYTGATLVFTDLKQQSQAQALQIDHVVPLAEAWMSGAATWDAARLEQFANDLDGLLAVDGPANAAKGADDPAAWRPVKEHQCAYASRWITVKHRWQLTVDGSEVVALAEMLGYC